MSAEVTKRDVEITGYDLEEIGTILEKEGLKVKIKKGVLKARRGSTLFGARKLIALELRDAGDKEIVGTVLTGSHNADMDWRVIFKKLGK